MHRHFPDELSLELPADVREIRAVRQSFGGWLGEAGIEGPLRDEIVLAASELVTNAVQASPDRAPILVHATRNGAWCRVEVTNHGALPTSEALDREMPAVDQASGRGLGVARALADRLEVTSPSDGLVSICFERDLSPRPAAPTR